MAKKEFWIYAATDDTGSLTDATLELLGKALKCGPTADMTVCALLLEDAPSQAAAELGAYGAERIYRGCNEAFRAFAPNVYTEAICTLVRRYLPEVLLFAADETGRELAARTASLLDVGLTADCTEFQFDTETGKLMQIKPAFGSNLMANLEIPNCIPQIATLLPGVSDKASRSGASGEIVDCELEHLPAPTSAIKDIARRLQDSASGLNQAPVVVACGRGTGGEKGIALVKELARALNAEVGCTKAVTDAGWMSHDRLIGQTGTSIAPKLYIGCGISGAVQHTAGISKSSVLVAINSDPHASIFEIADYGIVGDLFQVIPALIHEITGSRKENTK